MPLWLAQLLFLKPECPTQKCRLLSPKCPTQKCGHGAAMSATHAARGPRRGACELREWPFWILVASLADFFWRGSKVVRNQATLTHPWVTFEPRFSATDGAKILNGRSLSSHAPTPPGSGRPQAPQWPPRSFPGLLRFFFKNCVSRNPAQGF